MCEAFDDCPDEGLEDLLAEGQGAELHNVDACLEEVDLAIADVKNDLYRLHRDSSLEEIESSMDKFRDHHEIDDYCDWQDEVNMSIDRVRRW